MSEGIVPVEPGTDTATMRAVAAEYPRTVARLSKAVHTPAWSWATLGIWVPDTDPTLAADQARELFATATPDDPVHARILWHAPDESAPQWWLTAIHGTGSGGGIAWLRGHFANPTTAMIDLADVAAIQRLGPGAPTSCLGTDRDDFASSPLRPVPDPDSLVPAITMTDQEAACLRMHWLHWTSHLVGTLYPIDQAQADACQERLFTLAVDAVARGPLTRIDAVAFTADTAVDCPSHTLEPLPGYVHGADARTVGVRVVAHPSPCGRVAVHVGNLDLLDAVLGVVARYGGTLHLTTTDPENPDGAPPVADTLYVVHGDMRAELVQDDRAREITALDRLVGP